MTRALICIADGTEEMEAVIVIDVLRRAGWEVAAAAAGAGPVTASRGVRIVPDAGLDAVAGEIFDVLVIPGGGPGVENLKKDPAVLELVRRQDAGGRWLASICAGPLVLQEAGVLEGRTLTSHPSAASKITQGTRIDDRVVIDGRLITSQGPGTCFDFALTLVRLLDAPEKAAELARAMVYNRSNSACV